MNTRVEALPAWQFTVDLPDEFVALDLTLDPPTDRAAIEGVVERRLANVTTARPEDRRYWVAEAMATLVAARELDAIGAALVVDQQGRTPLHAYLMVFCLDAPDEPDRRALEALAKSLRCSSAHGVGPLHAEVVELGGRPAVREAGVSLVEPNADSSQIVAGCRYWVPVAGTGTQLVMWFWTPYLEVADEMAELFDSIAIGLVVTAG